MHGVHTHPGKPVFILQGTHLEYWNGGQIRPGSAGSHTALAILFRVAASAVSLATKMPMQKMAQIALVSSPRTVISLSLEEGVAQSAAAD